MGNIISTTPLDSSVFIDVRETRGVSGGILKFYLGFNSMTTEIKKEYDEGEGKIVLFHVDNSKEILVQQLSSKNEFIASAVIPLEQFRNNHVVKWYTLKNEKGQSAGDVDLGIVYNESKDDLFSDKTSVYSLTLADVIGLRKAFDSFDKDGGGTISKKELETALKARGKNSSKHNVKNIILSLDDHVADGEIDFVEFLKLSTNIPEDELNMVLLMFTFLDTDKSGLVTKKELEAFLKRKGKCFTNKDLDLIASTLESMGRNQGKRKLSGRLDFSDFLILMVLLKLIN